MSFCALVRAGLLGCSVLACSDGAGPGDPASPGITVLAGANARDTAGALLAELLHVEVRDSTGRPRADAVVRFTAARLPTGTPALWVSSGTVGSLPVVSLDDTTDARGRAAVRVRLGFRAGGGTIEIAVPQLGYQNTAAYTIVAGTPVSVTVAPRDTALYVGRSFTLRAHSVDRFGNQRDTAVALSGASSGIAVSATNVITGVALGREHAVARIGTRMDTARVSIVPAGTIAAHASRAYVGDSIGIVVVNLDGSEYRRVVVETPPREYGGEEPPGHEMPARWDPAGARLIYDENTARVSGNVPGLFIRRILVHSLNATTQRFLPASPFYTEAQADFTRDGRWVFFSARREEDDLLQIWRAQSDGSNLERVVNADDFTGKTRPAVSPDGAWLAYVADDGFGAGPQLRVRHIATGEVTALGVAGTSPRWSPAGDVIAYVNSLDASGYSGELRIIRPDGTDDRAITSAALYAPGIDWSPDGRFIIGARSSYGGLELIEAATGARIPLPFGGRLSSPAWRPR